MAAANEQSEFLGRKECILETVEPAVSVRKPGLVRRVTSVRVVKAVRLSTRFMVLDSGSLKLSWTADGVEPRLLWQRLALSLGNGL